MPHLIALSIIQEAPIVGHLTVVIVEVLEKGGDVGSKDLGEKLLCFGAHGITVFQGARTSVTKQLHTKYAPFSIGIHCFAHRVNLAGRTLSTNTIFQNSEKLMQKAYAFSIACSSNFLSFRS